MQRYELTVGAPGADFEGFTNVHIQGAVDRLACLGGGVVTLTAGTFAMADALHLRTNVLVRGQGEDTVLAKLPMRESRVACGLGYGHHDLVVEHPGIFAPGDGVLVFDDETHGFGQSTGTLVSRDGDTWLYTGTHAYDYRPPLNARVRTLYSLVRALGVADATVEDLAIAGNAAANEAINGCRGGGFFAHLSQRVTARRLVVRDFNGDGFSFQTCDDLELADCLAEGCTGTGFHPGSGSNRFHIHGCTASGNGRDGLFYCLRVRHGLLEDSVFESNGGNGVSTGGRDTDNLNRRLTIQGNGGCGVFLREREAPDAPHRTVFEDCDIGPNGTADGEAEVLLQGAAEGVVVRRCRIVRGDRPAILLRGALPEPTLEDNDFEPAGDDAVVDAR